MTSISLILFECLQYYTSCSLVDSPCVADSFIIIIKAVCIGKYVYKEMGLGGKYFLSDLYFRFILQECNAMSELILIGNADVSSYVSPFSPQ